MKSIFLSCFLFYLTNHLIAQKIVPTEDMALVNVTVSNYSKKPLIGENISFLSQKDKKQYSVVSDKEGKAQLLLPEGDVYDIAYRDFTEQKNYSTITIPKRDGAYTFTMSIKFEPAKTFTLKNVHFETAKATITPDSYASLNELVEVLKAKQTMTIEIAGHTDNVGSQETNLKLSQDRAAAVRNYLISKGINKERVTAKGYADSLPVASNDTEEGKAKNRRTEVRIIHE
jgi:outer membrane protein OmpA-like peptidoglycan-associated protein